MAWVFRRAARSNEGDRDLLSEHLELTLLEPPAEDDVALVAEVTGRLVGFATAGALDDDAFTVTDLFVDPDHMRSGIGRALIEAVVVLATTSERTRIEVEANRHSVAFYRRLGVRGRTRGAGGVRNGATDGDICARRFAHVKAPNHEHERPTGSP